jgi:hypothetical protein
MDTTSTPWEPPLAGTEVQALLGALDRMRARFRWKADGLDAQGPRSAFGAWHPMSGDGWRWPRR